jgi:hypothetical protein
VTLTEGEHVTCTIHNDDQAASLTVIKDVKNDNGGNANPDDFQLIVNGGGVLSGAMNTFPSNTPLAINETPLSGYDFVNITGDAKCPAALGGTVTLKEGEHVTCIIHNDDQSESVVLLNPADSICSGLAVNFQWKIENQRPSKIYCSSVITDKGLNPFDGSLEDIFDAGQSTSFLVSLDPFFYDPADFQWGVRVTVCNGLNDTCPCKDDVLESAVRNLQTSSQPSSCH